VVRPFPGTTAMRRDTWYDRPVKGVRPSTRSVYGYAVAPSEDPTYCWAAKLMFNTSSGSNSVVANRPTKSPSSVRMKSEMGNSGVPRV